MNWDQEKEWSTRLIEGYVGDFDYYIIKLSTYMREAGISDDVTQNILSVSVDEATLLEEQRMSHNIYLRHCIDSAYVVECALMWGMGVCVW